MGKHHYLLLRLAGTINVPYFECLSYGYEMLKSPSCTIYSSQGTIIVLLSNSLQTEPVLKAGILNALNATRSSQFFHVLHV